MYLSATRNSFPLKMKQLILVLFSFFTTYLSASPGDTTWVSVHNKTQMTWYERYSEKALFPDGSKSYHKILMYYRLGCANGGCSDWDYTTRVSLLHPSGILDSSIATIDTLSTNPLQIDTSWNVFEVKETFELARVMTPYANGFAASWGHDFVYDLTDFYPLLKDSVEIEVFYQGWSAGFSADIKFALIEGTPPREVTRIDNLYMGSGSYLNSADFENDHLPQKTIALDPLTTGMDLRVNFSGHGFVNSLNCAEFCKKNYYLKVNGQQVASQAIWRDDCGLNPIWPQPGTWLYDRANWCPGDKSLFRRHQLSQHVSGNSVDLNLDIEAYSYTVPPNETPAGYNYAAQLIQYKDPVHQNDVELERILAPSDEDEFGRINPVCGTAQVKIRNLGAQSLSSCVIRYGLKGQSWKAFNWTGNLATMQTAVVELPFGDEMDWWSLNGQSLQFEASVELPNGQTDEYPLNDSYSSTFTAPKTYPSKVILFLKTNDAAHETHWSLSSLDGTVIDSGDNLQNNQIYQIPFELSPGCYIFSLKDRDKDGLSFFANNDGSGFARFLNDGGAFFIDNLNENFGTELRQHFTVGYTIGSDEITPATQNYFAVYPNPASDQLTLDLVSSQRQTLHYQLVDISGKTLRAGTVAVNGPTLSKLSLGDLARGVYLLKAIMGKDRFQEKIILK